MYKTCRVCNHPDRQAIEERLIAGEPLRKVAERFGTSAPALCRHKAEHLAQSLVRAHEAQDIARADSVLADIRQQMGALQELDQDARKILEVATRSKDHPTALKAIREMVNIQKESRATHELIAKLTGEMSRAQKVEHSGGEIPFLIVMPAPTHPPRRPVEIDIPGRMALPVEEQLAAQNAEILDGDPEREPDSGKGN